MAPELTDEQVEELKKTLAQYDLDKNGDGTTSREALVDVLEAIGIRAADSDLVGTVLDAAEASSGGEGIDIGDFLRMLHSRMQALDDPIDARAAFRALDKDGDGAVSLGELQAIVESSGVKLPREEVERLLKEADTNGDGCLSADQFVCMAVYNK